MNLRNLRGKRVIITTIATVVALGAGGLVWMSAAGADADVSGGERDRIGTAAVQAVGGGTAVDVETDDDNGGAYEVEVRKPDGAEVDVRLDRDLKVLEQKADTPDTDTPDADDRVLSDIERTSAEKAALTAVPGATVTDVEAGDGGTGYEVELRATDGAEWDVDLGADLAVLGKKADD